MPAIVPRWEWRAFGAGFGAAEERIAALGPKRVEESDELYLLSVEGGDTVKVRDGAMDVKHLEQVNAEGLEQWRPVMKGVFPLAAADVRSVLGGLHVAVPPLARTAYTLGELVDELVRPSDELLAVEVHKRRERYAIRGFMAELTEVCTESVSTRTIAVESEDPSRVLATVRELGLGRFRTSAFPAGSRRSWALARLGTQWSTSARTRSSFSSPSGRPMAAGEAWMIAPRSRDSGRVSRRPVGSIRSRWRGPSRRSRPWSTRRGDVMPLPSRSSGPRVCESHRTARSSSDAVEARCGVRVEVITGEEEGRLAYLAVKSALGPARGSLVVFDTGGGSSQFTFGDGEAVAEQFSVNVGAARFTDQFGLDGPVTEDVLAGALDSIAADLGRLDGRLSPDTLVGMGGAVTNLAAVRHELAAYDPGVVQGTVLERAEVDRQIELYRTRTADERRQIVGLQPKRAEVILAGACIVRTVMAKLARGSLTVSDRGLRHGLLVERFG